MTFKRLSEYFKLLEENSSRLKITEILAELFREASKEEIAQITYLSLGRLLPAYRGLEFQMAEKMLQKALVKAFGVEPARIEREMKNLGDLGNVGESIKYQVSSIKYQRLFEKTKEIKDLEVIEVYERLLEIAKESGEGSVERKINKTAVLLEDLDSLSVRYVIRIPIGKMRLGFSDMTVLDGLSWMVAGDKSLRTKLEDAYNVVADVGEIAVKIKDQISNIKTKNQNLKLAISPKLGIPIVPALCQRIGTAEEIVDKLGEIAVEPKYDGVRLQVHAGESGVSIFTRNLENVTPMFPDIVEALKNEVQAKEAIFDGEAVGFNPKTKHFIPFQETMKRKRKHLIGETIKEIPVKYFVFDILYKNGESLVKEPFAKRRKILSQTIDAKSQTLKLSPQILTSNAGELREFHRQQIEDGLEGIVAKKWQSAYEPGRRGFHWVKLKQEMTKKGGGLADTIDCLVMGVTRGKGKRAGFGVGSFLVGARKADKYVTITNIGTGLTDDQFKQLDRRSRKLKIKEKPGEYLVAKGQEPDVWLKPEMVVEIQADNVTKSSIHTAGLALRFPRLINFRDDKNLNQVTTVGEVEKLFDMQFGKE